MSDRPFALTVNKNVPQVQNPVADVGSLLTTAKSLQQGVESLGGYRGALTGRAVTFEDLAALGLVTPVSGNTTGTVVSGVATKDELAALKIPVLAYAALPAAPVVGQQAVVTDSLGNTWGTVVVGGGGLVVLVWWNGTAWMVLGT